jgi:ABC-type multidrug transport system fused ATPase/permease subunit
MRQSLDFFGRSQSGRLLSRVLNDTQMAQESLVSIVGELVKQPLTAIGVIARVSAADTADVHFVGAGARQVAVVVDRSAGGVSVVGLLTKIDLIEHMLK